MMQVASVIGIIVGSVSINKISEDYRGYEIVYEVDLRATNGCFIFLCLVETVLQIVAITELFLDIKLLKIKIPLGKSLWYLVNIVVSEKFKYVIQS